MATHSDGDSETGGVGSGFDEFLKDEGILDDVTKTANQRVADWMNRGAVTGRISAAAGGNVGDTPKPKIDYKAWYDAATDLCVIDCIGWQDDDPRGSLMNLIQYEITLAQDPCIGGERVEDKQIAEVIKRLVADKIVAGEPIAPQDWFNFAHEVRKLKPVRKS